MHILFTSAFIYSKYRCIDSMQKFQALEIPFLIEIPPLMAIYICEIFLTCYLNITEFAVLIDFLSIKNRIYLYL